ncbi:hypothetical protein [Rheinheimera sp. 1928-s]|uniref:hypothetical protein n=1 Tax=Rheinheimera sp. 1928-s TaxID=3033803 RepID=UPI00263609A4|nr:hypothetical protein [Rheinheimera sp. 1928-s]MDF3125546.1 hypothetical protein [Rheinheimera sp. 1928-s]
MCKVVIIAALFCCQSLIAAQVTWLKTDWPPHQITTGVYQDQGTFDVLHKLLIAQLPHLTHQVKVVNLPRLEQAFLQNNYSVCSFGSIFTEKRAKTRWYSKAVTVLPGLAVHFRTSAVLQQHAAMQADGSIDIRQLAQDKTLLGAYQPNRFYPASVMDATQYANFIPHEFTSEVNAAALLLSKRVDYVVEYPERMAFYLKHYPQKLQIQSRAVVDASPYVVSYITCNKSPAGQQLITEINQALMALWLTPAYKTAMFSWVDASNTDRLEKVYQDYLRKSAATTEH